MSSLQGVDAGLPETVLGIYRIVCSAHGRLGDSVEKNDSLLKRIPCVTFYLVSRSTLCICRDCCWDGNSPNRERGLDGMGHHLDGLRRCEICGGFEGNVR